MDMTKIRGGQAALSTVFLIGGIIVLFGISLAMIALAFSDSTLGFQAANRALALARGGVADAELQLVRNKDFTNTSGYCVPAMVPPCSSGYATVTVTQNSPAAGKVTVVSDATFNRRRRKVQVIYQVSSSTTQVVPVSQQELTL